MSLLKFVTPMVFFCALYSQTQEGKIWESQENQGQERQRDCHYYVEGEFLWWHTHLDGLGYVTNSDYDPFNPDPPDVQFENGHIIEPSFHYDPGFRVSLGYIFSPRSMDLAFRWTRHTAHASQDISVPVVPDPGSGPIFPTEALIPTKALLIEQGITINGVASRAAADWNNKINVLDFEIGYSPKIDDSFCLRLFSGAKSAWIDSEYDIDYYGIVGIIEQLDPFHTSTFSKINMVELHNTANMWGVGPLFGISTDFKMKWGIALHGLISTAFLYGESRNTYGQNIIEPFDNTQKEIADYGMKFFTQNVMSQLVFGLQWKHQLFKRACLAIHTQWEGQVWWNQNQFRYANAQFESRGNLNYSGLVTGVQLSF